MSSKIENIIKKYNISPNKVIVAIFLIIIILLSILVRNNIHSVIFTKISNVYSDFLILSVKLFSNHSHNLTFDLVKNQILSANFKIHITRFYFSLFQIISIFILVIITKSPFKNKILIFFIGFVTITLYNILRILFHAYFPSTISTHNLWFNLILIPRWLIVIAFVYFYWQKFPNIRDFLRTKLKFDNKYYKRFIYTLSILVVAYYLIVILMFNDYIFLNGSLLIKTVLNSSKSILHYFGFQTWVGNRLLYNEKAALYMDDACIGINLMFVFAAFILLLPGKAANKLWFIPMGLIIIVLLNILRIVFIFISMYKANGHYILPLDIHDVFTYPVLIFTLLLWNWWINKFMFK